MVYIRPSEVTVPLRFICKTVHLIAVLTVLFDLENVIGSMTNILLDTATQEQASLFHDKKTTLKGLCWTAIICFIIEYITMLLGLTMYFGSIMLVNITFHFVGAILVILFYTDNWNMESFIAFFVCFNGIPAIIELLAAIFVSKFTYLRY
mmetsp:Transcript_1456/g.2102  ORF Transcript_1456/g.2102 Transcript_1456/m.2102 type:complete len:150 (-) Transcript_1456:91-540(-)